jgi:TonB-dependent receptor
MCPRHTPSLLALLISQAFAAGSYAQEVPAQQSITVAASAAQSVVIEAQRTTASTARDAQREAPNLVNLMTAGEMRKLPDVNTAEAVRRVAGISLETDTGEGRYINIRGIDSDLNSTTFGGLRLPPSNNASPFGGGRAVALDAIPTGLVGAITVTKTLLPDQDAEALGGTIEITPKTAPRGGQPFLDARLGTGYEPLRRTAIGEISMTGGTRFGGVAPQQGVATSFSDAPFSIVATGTYYEDKRGIDDVEPSFIDKAPNAYPSTAYAGWDQRFYKYHRRRHGIGLDLGYQPDQDDSYYIRFFDAGYTESVLRNRLTITPDGSPTLANGQFTDGMTANGFDKTLRDEKERIDNKVLALGGNNRFNGMFADYRLGFTEGSYKKLHDYNSDFNYTPSAGTITYDSTGEGNTPHFAVAGADYLNPANYTLAKFQNSTQDIRDKEFSTTENLRLPVSWGNFDVEYLKVGINGRWRKRSAAGQPYSYKGVPALSLADYVTGGNVNFYHGQYDNGPNIVPGDLQNTLAQYQTISADDAQNAALESQKDREDVYAGYGQYQMVQDKTTITGGLRVEATRARYDAIAQGVDAAGNSFTAPVGAHRSYTNFFPSLQARYDIDKTMVARAAYSTAVARPGFNQVTPSLTIDPAANIVSSGNPGLKPITDNAFDFAVEKYLPFAGIVSAGLFDKEFKNYIVNRVTSQTFPNNGLFAGFVGVAHVVSYDNVRQAHARGVELNYEQRLPGMPEVLDGLALGANYTFVDSEFAIRPGEKSTLPSTSKHTLNAFINYERDGVNMRLAGYLLSRNLWAIGGTAGADLYSERRFSLDFGSSYAINKRVSVYFNAKNLTNTPLTFTEGQSNRVIQREFYGQTYQLGADLHF